MILERIVEKSVERRGLVVVLWAALAAVGVAAVGKLSIDAVPDVTNVQVSILTAAPGLSPLEVEQYLTFPIETAMNGVPQVEEIRSVSRTAVSAITVVFRDGTDIWRARQMVSERLTTAKNDIPPGYGQPELAPVSTGLGEIFEFYLTSQKHSPMELRTLLDWTVAPRLRSVPGVVEVNAMGGEVKEYQVILDPKRLAGLRVTLAQVHEVLENNNGSIGGGYIEKNREAFVIRGYAQFRTVADIENTVISSDETGTPVLLKHVARVQIGAALRFGTVTKHGEGEIVAGTVMMLTGSNSREVVSAVKTKLDGIRKLLPAGVEIRSYYDRADFISRMLKTVIINLAEGAALVIVVLFLTLGSLRGAMLAALAIPMSMAVAMIGMVRMSVTGNLMSLGAIDFGLLVDGAIVMLEAALVEIALARNEGKASVPAAVSRTMARMARPVTFSLAIIMLVYLPLMALQDVEGRMFRPMAITVALALGGALAFSLTGFPALAALLLKPSGASHHGLSARVFDWVQRGFERLLVPVLRHPRRTLGAAAAVLAIAGASAMNLGAEFQPRLDEGEILLDVRRLPSVSIGEAQRLGALVEQVVSEFPEVLSVVTRTGRAEVATDPVGPDEANVRVKLRPKEEWTTAHDPDELGEAMKRAVEKKVPATFAAITQPIEDRVNQLLAGSRADVVIKVFGDDLEELKTVADRIGAIVKDVPGRGDWRVQRVLGLPLLEVVADRERLARYGIAAKRVLEMVEASRVGQLAGKIFEGPRRFDLKLFLPPASLTTDGFGDLLVGAPGGQLVPLASIGTIAENEGPAVINRESLQRRVLVEVNVRGRDLVGFVKDAQRRVADAVKLPPGVTVQWAGQFENFTRASTRLGLVAPLALLIIFGMLFLMFGGAGRALVVFAGVPLAAAGGVFALALRGLPFSIPAAVGFIAVAGVAVLNGVVMASEVFRREQSGDDPNRALLGGVASVLRPVLTTALVAAVGFLPMAISTRAGAEVQRPLATVVIGGIISSTLLCLAVLPVLLKRMVGRPGATQQ